MTNANDTRIDPNDPLMKLIQFAANPPKIPDLPAQFDPEKVELPEYLQWARKEYVFMRVLDDGRVCGIHRLMFHWTIHIDLTPIGYEDRYCYEDLTLAIIALQVWSGEGDPVGWHKHPKTGRTRNLRTGRESFEWEPELPEERNHASR